MNAFSPTSYHTIIIGGGPAGLAAAISSPHNTLLLEKNRIFGKKLLLSGQGMCNFTNSYSHKDFLSNCREFANFIKKPFYRFDNNAFIELLQTNGCEVIIREDGKVFPASLQSVTVRDTLFRLAQTNGTKTLNCITVQHINYLNGSFEITASDLSGREITTRLFKCSKLIIATGGCSYPKTGSNGSGFQFAASLGHTIVPVRPALSSLEIKDYGHFRNCAGNSLSAVILTFASAKGKKTAQDDLLFTHKGLSGPLILNNSYLFKPGDTIRLAFVKDADDKLPSLLQQYPQRSIRILTAMSGIPQALADALLMSAGLDGQKQAAHLTRKERHRIVSLLSETEFTISKLQDVRDSMGNAGGVDIKEVDPTTMESRLVRGLYFAGDVLSYSLPTGGYSIQTAFSTGWVAATS